MDPYVSINPVHISAGTVIDEWRDSFGHVVCYESEFKEATRESKPKYDENKNSNYGLSGRWDSDSSSVNEDSISPSKTFKAFTETVEALALQQSVIGNKSTRPAPPDEVAKVVAEVERRWKSRGHRGDGTPNDDNKIQAVDARILERGFREAASTVSVVDDEGRTRELIRIPPESLKTERRTESRIVWSPRTDLLSKPNAAVRRNLGDSEVRRNVLMTSFISMENPVEEKFERHLVDISKRGKTPTQEAVKGDSSAGGEEALLLLRAENARLQGRLDVLQEENGELLEARTELGRTVADLVDRVRRAEEEATRRKQDDEAVTRNLGSQKARLESVVLEARGLIEEKEVELNEVSSELQGSRKLVEKLEAQVSRSRTEVQSLHVTIGDLKSKITEIYVDQQTTNQGRILLDNEVESLRGELKAALAAKEWYKEQLSLCQRDKSQLQAEVTTTKAKMIRQATTIEKLKADNTRTKVYLNEVEQRLLSEKLSLAKHLEAIEAEMMEREVLQMQSNKEYMTLRIIEGGHDEGWGTEGGAPKATGESEELSRCKLELEKYRALHESVSGSLAECRKTCASLRSERDAAEDALERDRSEAAERIGKAEMQSVERDVRIEAVEREKTVLQMELTSTTEEKRIVDESSSILKQNIRTMEQNFQSLKIELMRRTEELDSVKKLLGGRSDGSSPSSGGPFLREIKDDGLNFLSSPLPLLTEVSFVEISTQTQNSECSAIDDDNNELMEVVRKEKEEVETKLLILMDQLKASRERYEHQAVVLFGVETELESVRKEAEDLGRKLSVRIAYGNSTSAAEAAKSSGKKQETVVGGPRSEEKTRKVRSSMQGRSHLQGIDTRHHTSQIQREDSYFVHDDHEKAAKHHETARVSLMPGELDANVPLGSEDIEGREDGRSEDCRMCREVERRLEDLRMKFAEAERKAMAAEEQRNKVIFLEDQLDQANQTREVETIRHEEERERLRGEASALDAEVRRLQEEVLVLRASNRNTDYRDASDAFKSAIFESSRKKFYGARMFEVEELEGHLETPEVEEPRGAPVPNDGTNERAENKEEMKLRVEMEEKEKKLKMEMEEEEKVRLTSLVERLSEESESLRSSLVEEQERTRAGFELRLYETRVAFEDDRRRLVHEFSLELERERGKFMELSRSHQLLKEHVARLERLLSEREAGHAPQATRGQSNPPGSESSERMSRLEQEVVEGHNLIKESKKALMMEKATNVRLKLDVEELTEQNKQLHLEVTSSLEQLSTSTCRVESLELNVTTVTSEMERLSSEIKFRITEEERLKRELEDVRARDATLNDQIATLTWKISQRDSELASLEERMELMVERQTCEVNSLTESLQIKTSELQFIQSEVVILTRERSELRARIVQFKKAIADILKQHSHASERGKMSVNELILNKEEMERLLVDVLPQSDDNKPLSFLQVTLSSLRGEIDSLQNQVNEHTTAVQSSSMAWKELEAQVQDLRRICRSSAASRAQSDQLLQDTDRLIQAAASGESLDASSSSSSSSAAASHVVISTTKTSITSSHLTSTTKTFVSE